MKRGRREGPPGSVRIIGGKWRGRRLPVFDQSELRPTGSRIRETLFNWLNPVIAGARCLDLFAGTGALGLEALSRGAARATLLERDPEVCNVLRQAILRLSADEVAAVHCADALAWLRGRPEAYDVVFVDPPFGSRLMEHVLPALAAPGWLRPDALIYLESAVVAPDPVLPAGWTLYRDARAGNVRYMLIRCAAPAPAS